MAYIEYCIEILDREEKVLRNMRIPMIKILWQHHTFDEATWELKDEMRTVSRVLKKNLNLKDKIFVRWGGCDSPKSLYSNVMFLNVMFSELRYLMLILILIGIKKFLCLTLCLILIFKFFIFIYFA